MSDTQTLSIYDQRVHDYAKIVKKDKPDPDLVRFSTHVTAGGKILDLGCGPAHASVYLRDHGLRVDPVDASREMVSYANKHHDIGARLATFDDIHGEAIYDGVWANFCLLHAPKSKMPDYLHSLRKALKPHGVFHIGMKLGEGERRDTIGRFYAYYGQEELTDLLKTAGFEVLDFTLGEEPGLSGEIAPWVTILARCAKVD